jgi:hypothetical protein
MHIPLRKSFAAAMYQYFKFACLISDNGQLLASVLLPRRIPSVCPTQKQRIAKDRPSDTPSGRVLLARTSIFHVQPENKRFQTASPR